MHYMLLHKFKNLENAYAALNQREKNFLEIEDFRKGFNFFFDYRNDSLIQTFFEYFDQVSTLIHL